MDKIIRLEKVDSTNNYLKQHCDDLDSGTVVTAEEQTAGRGRLGHLWNSNADMLPMSILFKDPPEPETLTARIGLGVCEALEQCPEINLRVSIKWPNDIIMENHKVCGILCESIRNGDKLNVICGIGVNISQTEKFFQNAELFSAASIAMLCGSAPNKEALLQLVAKSAILRANMRFSDCYCDYKNRVLNLGREVRIISANSEKKAFAEDIAKNGFLICRDDNGTFEVNSGEVSVRGANGYI